MSSNHQEQLFTVAARAIYANYTLTMVETGIHLFMALYGLSVFLETSILQRKGRKRYIVASFVITALSALTASLDMAHYFQIIFKSTSPGHWIELMAENFNEDLKRLLSDAGIGLAIMIGDALLVYRCYIVCVEYRWVAILPLIMSLSALVVWSVGVYVDTTGVDATRYSAASTFLTVSTNILVTGLITFRLLRTRQDVSKLLPIADARLYTGVISILIESAAPLTVFGIIGAILQQVDAYGSGIQKSPAYFVCLNIFVGLFYSFCTLSPHMIIFRVTTGRSFTKLPTAKDGVLSNPIQFAHQTAESSFLQSTFNREFDRNQNSDTERGLNTSIGGSTVTQT